ncbi:MAG: hypothetical protein J1E61_04820 [Lachnospiraceae bacterium]|nr:hypothetical protein [Lachnospiraceae bacterium]
MKKNKKAWIAILAIQLFILPLIGCSFAKGNPDGAAESVSEDMIPKERDIAPISDPLVVEARETLPLYSYKYLDIKDGVDSTKIELHFDEVDPTRCGEYPASASYEGQTIEFTIRIVDTTPPQIIEKEEIPVFSTKDTISCEDLVEVQDMSEVSLSFIDNPTPYIPEKCGRYTLSIEATDAHGNKSQKQLDVYVRLAQTDPTAETMEQIKNDNRLSLALKGYLLGQETAVIGADVNFDRFASPIASGQSATIQDMYNMIESGDNLVIGKDHHTLLTEVRYGLLDCGMDGKFELIIQYDLFYNGFSWNMSTVICEDQGTLTLSFVGDDTYRYYSYMCTDGCYFTDNSSSNVDHFSTYDILDATGSAKNIYELYTTFWFGRHSIIDPDKLAMRDYFGYDSVDEITEADEKIIDDLLDPIGLDIYTMGTETYLNCHTKSDPNADDKLSLPYYLSLCEKNGTVFYSDEEVNALINQRMSDLGFRKWTGDHPHEYIEWKHLIGSEFAY